MADAVALCAVVQAVGKVAASFYRVHLKGSVEDHATKTKRHQRSMSTKSEMKKDGKKTSKKTGGVSGASKTKQATKCDKESEQEITVPKTFTKRIVDTITDFNGGHQKKQILANNAKLEKKVQILKKQLHTEQKSIEKHLEVQIAVTQELEVKNGTLNERLHIEKWCAFANQNRAIEQDAKAVAEKKVLLDALDHAKAMADSKERELQQIQSACVMLRDQVEEVGKRAQVAEETASAQVLKSAQLEQRIGLAEAQTKQTQEKLVAADAEVGQAQQKVIQLETQAAKDQASIQETEKELREAIGEITKLRGDLEDEEENTRCLEDTNQKLEARLAESKASSDRLQESLTTEKEKGAEHQNLANLNSELQKKVASMKAEIAHLKDSLDISENETLQNQTDLDEARAQNTKLVEQLKDSNERAEKQDVTTFDLDDINDDELREKLAQALQQIQDITAALADANERMSTHNLTQLTDKATITQKDSWIEELEGTLSDRQEKLNILEWKLQRISKLVTKNMADFCEYGVEKEEKLRERCVKKNMQQRIPHCDYLKWEVDQMLGLVAQSD
ncbi:hypothetical protein PRZ48_002154 [Zasmidium cellare]|uniref:Uncharacterized protein n=1 Tax=Zasmidium cellare TaxID=395010 RepID=A0ABR0F572_ZASCE|nr:hypothetical protein PRZ48_002154 [Zasmidium cellare]